MNCFRGNISAIDRKPEQTRLYELNREARLTITRETARCQWRGESMDYSHAIESMQFLDSRAPATVLQSSA